MAALGLFLLAGAMAWFQPWLPRVPLLTNPVPPSSVGEALSCTLNMTSGPFVADPESGTRINGQVVEWPWGFTARRVGSEVQVLGWFGNVVATTGRTYLLYGDPRGPAFLACGNAYPE